MALQPYALVSLAEFKGSLTVGGDNKDDVIERAINAASRIIETDLERRLRYRAPEEVEGAANTVASVALAAGSLTVAAQPGTGGRTLIVSLTDTDRSVRAGTVTVTGTVAGTAGVTEAFDLADGPRLHGRRFFTAISGIVVASVVGATSSDFIRVGTSLGYVEYHTPSHTDPCRLRLLESPIYQIAEINEDTSRTYASTSALTVTTDYEFAKSGYVTRVSNSLPWSWWSGYRSVKGRYSAGYGGLATVPANLKDICIRLAAMKKQEFDRGQLNMSSVSDQMGNFTRFGEPRLTDAMRNDLAEYRQGEIFGTTAERDFDLEAV